MRSPPGHPIGGRRRARGGAQAGETTNSSRARNRQETWRCQGSGVGDLFDGYLVPDTGPLGRAVDEVFDEPAASPPPLPGRGVGRLPDEPRGRLVAGRPAGPGLHGPGRDLRPRRRGAPVPARRDAAGLHRRRVGPHRRGRRPAGPGPGGVPRTTSTTAAGSSTTASSPTGSSPARPGSCGPSTGSTRPTGSASTWPASTWSATRTASSGSSRTTSAARRA